MKLTTAFPLLCFSAFVMLAGLTYVDAQEAPPAGTSARVRRARPARTRPPNPAAAGTTGAEGVTEFESGVDFRPMSPRARVTFNLEEADLPDLVRLISNMTGKRFILPGKVRAIKATVYAPTKVTAAEAYNAFLSILEVNGLTVVPAGQYLKIMETGGIETQPLGMSDSGAIPAQDRYMTRLQRIDNVSAEDVANLLGRFKSSDGSVIAYAPTNTVIITDTGTQIRRMLRLIEAIDVERTGEQIWIEPIHYATAADLAARLIEIFPPADAGGGAAATPQPPRGRRAAAAQAADGAAPGGATATVGEAGTRGESSSITNIIADERTNSLIIIATERAYMRVLEMIRQLDIPLEGEGRIHVHYVQNGDASEIAGALQELIGGVSAAPAAPGAGGRAGAAGAAAATPDLFEGAIRVTSYEPTNALVITSSLHDYAALRSVIDRLDAPRRQVFIEAVIMELSVSRSNSLGFAFHGGVPDFPSGGDLTLLGFEAGRTATPGISPDLLTGVALGVRGQNIEIPGVGLSVPGFGVLVTALASSGDANVLSTPHIIAMDNVEAEISVGQNIPLQTSGIPSGALSGLSGLAGLAGGTTGAQGLGGLAGLAGLAGGGANSGFGSAPRQDVGTTIRITPHINQSSQIRMEIEEEISERGATEGQLGVVSINRRTAKTEVMARDQQTVVIGGLMRDSVTTSETKVPVLGDIPLIGALFRRTTSQTQKTNLLLFLTPYIIRDPADLRAIFERKMRERQEFLDRYFVFGGDDYEPPIDYSRTRGLVAEMMQNLRELEVERTLAEAAEAEPPPQHVPRPPVGIYVRDASSGEDIMFIEPGDGGGGGDDAGGDGTVDAAPAGGDGE